MCMHSQLVHTPQAKDVTKVRYLNDLCLAGEGSSDKHESMSNDHHLIGLNHLLNEEIGCLEILLITDLDCWENVNQPCHSYNKRTSPYPHDHQLTIH